MLNVPKKANDAMHLSMLDGCDISVDMLGDVVLQDNFQAWNFRQFTLASSLEKISNLIVYLILPIYFIFDAGLGQQAVD